ncbi:hypothetical protein OSB04_018138 [Centaurea solstitialis]|uniref:Uncharacterized protein n=1 Tax=Centaurea solstitialis TaxID=347529 RepID=A0AA38TP71_9ASTR|nr:hypothetical protein OSB04_018138 [Centaurea solstitialis]
MNKPTYLSSIWHMKHLRHLCLNGAHQNIPVQLMIHKAPSQLQTLWGLFIDEKIARTIDSALVKMTNLRKLDLTIESSSAITATSTTTTTNVTTNHSSSHKEIGLQIPSLPSLRSLRSRSKDHMGQPSELILKPFSCLENLSQLYLLGKLLEPLDWYQIPSGLKVLTLSVSQLDEDPMPTLSKLPSLIDLSLLAASYEGKEMCSPENGSEAMETERSRKIDYGIRNNEETAYLRNQAKGAPETLLKIEAFRKLILTNMPKTFEKEMIYRQKDHYDIEADS